MVTGEVVIEWRHFLDTQIGDLDLELGGLACQRPVGMVPWIRHAYRKVGAAVLADELTLKRERERPCTGLDEHTLAPGRFAPIEPAGEIERHHISRFHHRA